MVLLPAVSEIAARRVGLRAHGFRFSARTASGLPTASWFCRLPFRRLPLGELTFGLTVSAFRHAPLRGCRSAGWTSGSRLPLFGTHRFGVAARRVGLRVHRFPFSACTASELPSASWRFRSAGWPSGSPLPLFGMHRFGVAARQVDLRAHGFRFSARTASELPLGGLALPPSASEIALGGLAFGLTTSAFRHAPLRGCRSAGWPSGSPLRRLPLGGLVLPPPASELPLGGLTFGLTASATGHPETAPQRRRSEDRRSAPTRHLFHFKTLIPTC